MKWEGEVLIDGWEDQVQLPASSRVAVAGRRWAGCPGAGWSLLAGAPLFGAAQGQVQRFWGASGTLTLAQPVPNDVVGVTRGHQLACDSELGARGSDVTIDF